MILGFDTLEAPLRYKQQNALSVPNLHELQGLHWCHLPITFDCRLQTPGLEKARGRVSATGAGRTPTPALFLGLWLKTAFVSVAFIFNLCDAAVYPGRPLV